MSSRYQDHFSEHAEEYAAARPHYPAQLFDWLSFLPPQRELAWDCACGNGQAAVELARHFEQVIATDASEEQIANAQQHERVRYDVALAEKSGLKSESVDLITVAQALHWFDMDRFFDEALRVLKWEGVLAVWGYGLHTITPRIDELIGEYYEEIVGPYWPEERRYIDEEYRTIPFPLDEIGAPPFEMEHEWSLDELLAYIATWSATRRYIEEEGEDPLSLITPRLKKAWGTRKKQRRVTWPLYLRVGRVLPAEP